MVVSRKVQVPYVFTGELVEVDLPTWPERKLWWPLARRLSPATMRWLWRWAWGAGTGHRIPQWLVTHSVVGRSGDQPAGDLAEVRIAHGAGRSQRLRRVELVGADAGANREGAGRVMHTVYVVEMEHPDGIYAFAKSSDAIRFAEAAGLDPCVEDGGPISPEPILDTQAADEMIAAMKSNEEE